MGLPNNRSDFKDYCLRRLGAPVLKINVDDDQLEDRIDYALRKFMDYHFDGIDKTYYKHMISAEDIARKAIQLPDNVIGAVNLFPMTNAFYGTGMFNVQYQYALNNIQTFTSAPILPYYTAMYGLAQMEQMFVGQKPMRYNRYSNLLQIDMDWNQVGEGQFLIVEAYEVIDADAYPRMWQDSWLMKYTTAQFKEAWGTNLSKFNGMVMPGGVAFDGLRILQEARSEIEMLEEKLYDDYSLPPIGLIG